MVESPIFIVGASGSGTSLLRDLLRSHPRLAFPNESHFIPTFYRGFGHPGSEREARALAARILRLRWVRSWDLPVEPQALAHHRSFPELISQLYESFAAARGRTRWGDKTPSYVNDIPLLLEMFPRAKVLHIVRDGRDAASSWIRKLDGPGNVVAAAAGWRRRVAVGREHAAAHPGSCLEVSYESLLAMPGATMRQVCGFVGEDFDDAVLTPTRHPSIARRPLIGHRRRPGPISQTAVAASNATKWKHTMSARDRAAFEEVAGDMLSELGYEIEGLEAPLGGPRRAALELSGFSRRRLRRFNRRDVSPATVALMAEARWRGRLRRLRPGL